MNLDYFLALSPVERVAGYLYHSAKLAMVGAKLRKDNREDDTWTKEEDAEWEAAAEELDGWWYAMSEEEKTAIEPADLILGSITRGEWPLEP
jgi:hypothetical protein